MKTAKHYADLLVNNVTKTVAAPTIEDWRAEAEKIFAFILFQPQHRPNIRVNEQIIATTVIYIDSVGNKWGEIETAEAIRRAKALGLSLVEINPRASPPVCKAIKWPYRKKPTEPPPEIV